VAVLTEMYNVVIRLSTLTVYYPGGVAAYESDCPNRTFCSDGEVCRVGFMSWADTELFMQSLRRFDVSLENGTAAIIREDKGLLQPSEWLEFHRIDGTPMARLVGSAINVLVAPPGWVPGEPRVLTTEAELRRQEVLAVSDGVTTYRDRTTGEVVHVGRALTERPSSKPWWKIWK